jgi:uncharacterized membrane protein HdeD (DUF308 family)
MKMIQYALLRAISAVLIGCALVAWPEAAIVYLVITIGVLFLVPGVVALFTYFTRRNQVEAVFPIAGLGSLLFGVWLIVMPAFFVGILMYVLGVVLLMAGISQLVSLTSARQWAEVPWGLYVLPVLVLVAGLVVLANPFEAATIPFILLGVSSVVYGLTDLWRLWKYRRPKQDADIQDAVILEETKNEEESSSPWKEV